MLVVMQTGVGAWTFYCKCAWKFKALHWDSSMGDKVRVGTRGRIDQALQRKLQQQVAAGSEQIFSLKMFIHSLIPTCYRHS